MILKTVDKTYFIRREFSLTLPGDIYIRYQAFKDEIQLAAALSSKVPIKIDIGAVFSVNPAEAKKAMTVCSPVERELVFDIDMTDYDDVRTCCSGAGLCQKCWPFLAIAAKVLDRTLRQDFGFKHLLWVYSGRRGIHCWIGDKRARLLKEDAREGIIDYLTLVSGNKFDVKKCYLEWEEDLHPSVQESLKIIRPRFEKLIITDQNLFETNKQITHLLDLCTNETIKSSLVDLLKQNKSKTPQDKWDLIQDKMEEQISSSVKKNKYDEEVPGRWYIEEVLLQYCYPRLDENVSKKLNHLLKAPFCIHPKTQRVCIPFDVETVDSFDPDQVPTMDEILTGDVHARFQKGLDLFESFIKELSLNDNKDERLEKSDLKMEF